jgi:serine/threonine protein kinase
MLPAGQFGCVYSALLSKNARRSNDYGEVSHVKAAVKVLKEDGSVDSQTVEAFVQEGLIMKDFCHQNVLNLLGIAIGERGLPMIVMPFMLHGNLKKYISNPALMVSIRLLIACCIIEGLFADYCSGINGFRQAGRGGHGLLIQTEIRPSRFGAEELHV